MTHNVKPVISLNSVINVKFFIVSDAINHLSRVMTKPVFGVSDATCLRLCFHICKEQVFS